MIFVKGDFDALPFPDLSSLAADDHAIIVRLANQLEKGKEKPWDEIDAFLFRLYGLDASSVQVAKDTL